MPWNIQTNPHPIKRDTARGRTPDLSSVLSVLFVLFVLFVLALTSGCGGEVGEAGSSDVAADLIMPFDSGAIFAGQDAADDGSVDDGSVDDGGALGIQQDVAGEDDAGTFGDTALDAAVNKCPGGPNCACIGNDDCDSAMCIQAPGGKQCAVSCVKTCSDGMTCVPVSVGADVVSICVPRMLHLCDPCSASKDCQSTGVADAACVDQGSAGAFCGVACSVDEDCPAKYTCQLSTSIEGASTKMCVRKATGAQKNKPGRCPCSPDATKAKLQTTCFVEHFTGANELVGKCKGSRFCGLKGLTTCAAPAFDVEKCDGLDNDCDGKTDEEACEDNNACTTSICDPKQGCKTTKLDKVACDADGDVCTVSDTCADGNCVAGAAKNCDDGNTCTIAACDLATGCTQTRDNGKPCDADGSKCTSGDTCIDGSCKSGVVILCDDKKPCTIDACDGKTGKCTYVAVPEGVACDDGSACTVADVCKAGQCGGSKLTCDDKNPCTANTCNLTSGCKTTSLDGAGCDDDNPCTVGDICQNSQCKSGGAKVCSNTDSCVVAKCKLTTGKCSYVDKTDGASCNDGSACSSGDSCTKGTCLGSFIKCDDGNPCTNDTCDKTTGCKHVALDQTCDDGNACTKADFCTKGICVGKAVKPQVQCDDNNPCTDDDCAPKFGCSHSNNQASCTDGDPCTKGDACLAGKCSPGSSICECKVDSDCAIKEDGDLCNGTLYCDKSNANFVCKVNPQTVVSCSTAKDGACSKAACQPKTGKCAAQPVNQGGGCDADGSVCTQNDACDAGVCKSGKILVCTDNNPCTDTTCSANKGCVKTLNSAACNDGDACTIEDVCGQGVCGGKKKPCDDNNPCTNDSCNKASGCAFLPNSQPCSDNDACTVSDVCAKGTCGGKTRVCADNNPCTDNTCDKVKGCQIAFNTASCKDNNACTVQESCKGGQCVSKPRSCDDGNPCTVSSCNTVTGCSSKAVANGSVCAAGKTCAAGKCVLACGTGSRVFAYTGAAATFTLPSCAINVTIEAWGAEGGWKKKGAGGRGAMMRGTFTGLAGKVVRVVVGGVGKDGICGTCGGGGGGGSFVRLSASGAPLLIAGGGGGASYQQHVGQGGLTSENGGPGGYGSVPAGQGGKTDNGGGGGTGAGGGGWLSDGKSNNWCFGGKAKGGAGGGSKYTGIGGFGGGGGSFHGGGGGGGYSGGSGGTYTIGGGGGGSYCSGSLVASVAATRKGVGAVVIRW